VEGLSLWKVRRFPPRCRELLPFSFGCKSITGMPPFFLLRDVRMSRTTLPQSWDDAHFFSLSSQMKKELSVPSFLALPKIRRVIPINESVSPLPGEVSGGKDFAVPFSFL